MKNKITAWIIIFTMLMISMSHSHAFADDPEPTTPPHYYGGIQIMPPMTKPGEPYYPTWHIEYGMTEEQIRRFTQQLDMFRRQQALGRKVAGMPNGAARDMGVNIQQQINHNYTPQQLRQLATTNTLLNVAGLTAVQLINWDSYWDLFFETEQWLQGYQETGSLFLDVATNFTYIGEMTQEILALFGITEAAGIDPWDWSYPELYADGIAQLNHWLDELYGKPQGLQYLPELPMMDIGLWKQAQFISESANVIEYRMPVLAPFEFYRAIEPSMWGSQQIGPLQRIRVYTRTDFAELAYFWASLAPNGAETGGTFSPLRYAIIWIHKTATVTRGGYLCNMEFYPAGSNHNSWTYPSNTSWYGIPEHNIRRPIGVIEEFIDTMYNRPEYDDEKSPVWIPLPMPDEDMPYNDKIEWFIENTPDIVTRRMEDIIENPEERNEPGHPGTPSRPQPGTPITPPAMFAMFPFCIPWDVLAIFRALSATPIEPVIEGHIFPDEFRQRYNLELEPIRLDFSKFDQIIKIVRTMMMVLFIIGLTVVTRRYIWTGGG